jgi:hypothetical protein
MNLAKYSLGVGDRFARQGRALLEAFVKAQALGVEVCPVWNKSNREHLIVGTLPADVRAEADAAVKALGWKGPYHVDADHIGLRTVDRFLDASDFFTLDVADFTGKPSDRAEIQTFAAKYGKYAGSLAIPGLRSAFEVTQAGLETIARKYLLAVREAGRIYRRIESAKGRENFITEVSMDETDQPQTPMELLFILAAVADEHIPAQTLAPKFTGRFNKGVDYAGEVDRFEQEFNDDLAVIAFAVREFGLPANLKLSVHSGSDKFSIYPPIHRALRRHDAGLHLKTAGTTWLEELIGLASAGGEGLRIAKQVYGAALKRSDELCVPYASVIAIDRNRLPAAEDVDRWSGEQFAAALRHDPRCKDFNPHLRQLLHVGYKVAAEMGGGYLSALEQYRETIARNVTGNIFERHLKPVFIGR